MGFFEDLSKAMKKEVMQDPFSQQPRQSISLDFDTDEEEFDLHPSSVDPTPSKTRLGSRNQIYGYQYRCPYIVTAHMGKNGPFSDDKVYDKEFVTYLLDSIQKRANQGHEGWSDEGLLCNRLKIHSIKLMRNQNKGENTARTVRYSSGGTGYFHVFVRVFTKKEVREQKNTEEEMQRWLQGIRDEFVKTKAMYPFRLENGGLLGRNKASTRALDSLLMDSDVAEYAKLFHSKKINAGTFLNDPGKVSQFFSVWNAAAAIDLLS